MTAEIQWEEDWFTVPLQAGSLQEQEQEQQEQQEQEQEQQEKQEQREKEQEQQEEQQEQQEEQKTERQIVEERMNQRMDILQTLVFQQSEMIRVLSQEIKELKSELHSTTHQSASQNDRTHQLLEELKRVKERELNYALRRHHPVPFFHTSSLLQWGDIQLPPKGSLSPLFRKDVSRSSHLSAMNL